MPTILGFTIAFLIDFFINWFAFGKFWVFVNESFFKYEVAIIVFLGLMFTYGISKTLLEYE